uniref:Cell division cycle 5-like protein n=2 Tax=Cajanus cajan TaxID=3821 RepID=A0A151U5N4_CAJCA|nr:hypothetical protein KK1_007225 [Cajanus cajan]
MRVKKSLWPQIEATLKQMDIAATELECFKALQKQEQLAASHRINNLWAEVQKQKELEKTLQNRYGSLIEELEKMQNIMDQYRLQAQQQKETEADNHAQETTETVETKTDETDVQCTENCEAVPQLVEQEHALAIEPSHDGIADQQVDIVQDHATSGLSNDMDVDSEKMQITHDTDVKLKNTTPAAENVGEKVEGNGTNNGETMLAMNATVEIISPNHDVVVDAVNSHDSSMEETNPVGEETN